MQIKDLVPELPVHPTKKPVKRALTSIKKIVVHTTDWVVTPQELATYDINPNHISSTGCPGITYHYLIERNGQVDRTAPAESITWHAGNHNNSSLAVALIYKTDTQYELGKKSVPNVSETPTVEQMDKLLMLVTILCFQLGVSPVDVVGHRELEGTGFNMVNGKKVLRKSCPGRWVNLDQFRRDVASKMQSTMEVLGFYNSKVDGLWGPISEKAFLALKLALG